MLNLKITCAASVMGLASEALPWKKPIRRPSGKRPGGDDALLLCDGRNGRCRVAWQGLVGRATARQRWQHSFSTSPWAGFLICLFESPDG